MNNAVHSTGDASSFKSAFFHREAITIYLASPLALACVHIALTVLPVYVKHVGGSDFAAGLQGTVFTVGGVVLRLFLGPLADRKGRLLPLRIGAFVFMSAPILIWIAPNLWFMAAARLYQAVGLATYLASASSYVTDVTPDSYRGSALGIYRMVLAFSMMVGPPVSMWIVQSFGFNTFFLFYALVGAGAFLGVMSLPSEPREAHRDAASETKKPGPAAGNEEEIVNGTAPDGNEKAAAKIGLTEIKRLFSNSRVSSSYLGIFTSSAFHGILLTYIPLYVQRSTEIANPALFFTIYAAVGALSAAAIGHFSDRYGRRVFILPLMLTFAAGLILLTALAALPVVIFMVSAFLTGIAFNAGLSLFISRIVDGAERHMKATALAFQESSIDLGISVGIFLFGLASGLFTYPVLFAALAVSAVAAPAVILRADKKRT